ncbi:MAG: DHA2 family efflux MFS transporter permease subunit [Polyangiaceae bacterium]|nr:DHA2 family efflux MFS transporter permease subunit [Polyangiaceae bacterium]
MSTAVALPEPLAAPKVNKWFVAAAVALGALMEIVDTSIVNVALTQMQASLGATLSEIGWVITSYGIANVIILPLSAWLGDRFGKKNYFIFSLIGFVVASALCGLATTLPMLVAARILQGLTGGGLLAKAQAILFETFPREEQAMAQGFFGAIAIAGPAIGPTLGGWIVTNVDWRWIFFINLPIGVIGVFMCMAALPRDVEQRVKKRVDWIAILMLAVGIGSFQAFLEEGNSEDWFDSPFIVALGVSTVVGIVAFVQRTLASDAPVVDLRVLRYRSLAAGSVLSIVLGMALYGGIFAIPIFAQTILGFTSQQVGMMMLPSALMSAVAMGLASRIVGKLDPRIALACGAVILTTSIFLLSNLTMNTSSGDFQLPLIIRSFGTVFMFLPLSLAAIGPIPKKDVAAASGFYNLTRQLGGSIGVAALTTLLARRQSFHSAVIGEKLVSSDPETLQRLEQIAQGFMARGVDSTTAHQQAFALLKGSIERQASVISFSDTFWATAVLIICTLPLILLLGKPQKGAAVAVDH